MVIKDIEINGEKFVLVMDTAHVPKGIRRIIRRLTRHLTEAMNAGKSA